MFDQNNDRAHVAFDIETTGFGYNESVTVVGFWFPNGHACLLLNTPSIEATDRDALELAVRDHSGVSDVSLHVCEGDSSVLSEIRELMYDRFDRNYNRLVAFNAESWKGGFDLPFLRSLCIKTDVPWVFDGFQFADLYEPLKKRLNTTVTDYGGSVDANTLGGSHRLLAPDEESLEVLGEFVSEDHPWYEWHGYDPFEDSGSAVRAYKTEAYGDVLLHNLADIHRTWELGELLRMYVSSKDFSTKKL